jgi:hypothetical protein
MIFEMDSVTAIRKSCDTLKLVEDRRKRGFSSTCPKSFEVHCEGACK